MKEKLNKDDISWELGSTNVFADLGMHDAEEKLAKAEMVFKINQIIANKQLKQAEAAAILKADQSKISLLKKGHLSHFSLERLLRYLALLEQDVDIIIKKSSKPTKHGKLRVKYA